MSNITNKDNNDEEAAVLPINEISFHPPQIDDDNNTTSGLSTLIAPSTLTPNYNDDLYGSHPGGGSGKSDDTSYKSQKAFQLAALLGMLSIGILFGADIVYMMATSQNDQQHGSNVSTAMSMDAFIPGGSSAGSGGGSGNSGGGDNNNSFDGGQSVEGKKQTKAAKKRAKNKKKNKKKDEGKEYEEGDEDDDEDDGYGDTDEEEDDEEDDGGGRESTDYHQHIISTRQKHSLEGSEFQGTVEEIHIKDHHHDIAIPEAKERCPFVIQTFEEQNEGITDMEFLREKYTAQSTDSNVFYRATALLFWKDFAGRYWGSDDGKNIKLEDLVRLKEASYEDGTKVSPMSTWTWITGDQHLSNFGAWRNRAGEVVFSDNDFDEAAIYDFHIDVLRIAVSICSHGFTNGLSKDDILEALEAFTYTYVKTCIDYVGGDSALVYELTPNTSTGVLRDFLSDVENKRSQFRQAHKFTEVIGDDGSQRRFVRNEDTRLEDVSPELEAKIRAEVTPLRYGASMMKMGYLVPGWDEDFFTVLDVARRVGSGIGSYGVDRFYVLLKGEDILIEEDQDVLSASVILDVKFEPISAVSRILDKDDPETKAWYDQMFRNEADRAAAAQRALTSYTDPFVGYMVIDGDSYIVRQRSPYKSSLDLGTLTNHRAFTEFVEQIAVVTATAHVRGTVAKSPGQFKHVIKLLLAGDRDRRRWSDLVAKIALSYREQVLLDFACFKDYVENL